MLFAILFWKSMFDNFCVLCLQETSSYKIAAHPERRRQFENDLCSFANVAISLLTACLVFDHLKEQVSFFIFNIFACGIKFFVAQVLKKANKCLYSSKSSETTPKTFKISLGLAYIIECLFYCLLLQCASIIWSSIALIMPLNYRFELVVVLQLL
jgi:hypothetical protein